MIIGTGTSEFSGNVIEGMLVGHYIIHRIGSRKPEGNIEQCGPKN